MRTRSTLGEKQKGRITFEKLFDIIGILSVRGIENFDLERLAKQLEKILIDTDINILWSIIGRLLNPGVDELQELLDTYKANNILAEHQSHLLVDNISSLVLQIENLIHIIEQELSNLNKSIVINGKYKYDLCIVAINLILATHTINNIDLANRASTLNEGRVFYWELQQNFGKETAQIGLFIFVFTDMIQLHWVNSDENFIAKKNFTKALFKTIKNNLLGKDSTSDILEELHGEVDILKFLEEDFSSYDRNELINYLLSSSTLFSKKEWNVNLKFSGQNNAANISKIIWSLSELLEGIDGVSVKLEDWGKGSFWTRLKIAFSNPENQKEAKEVLQKTREAIEAENLDKYIQEKEKRNLDIEKEKIEIKNQKIETESKELENKLKALEIEAKEIENAKAKIDLIKQIAYFVKEGMINSQPVQIDINGKNYLTFENNKLIPGVSMDEIEKGEEENPRNEEKSID